MNRAMFRISAFLTVMFFCFSCNNVLQEAQNENMLQGTARLRLNIAGAPSDNARTIFATNDDDITTYTYELKGRMPGKSEEIIYNNAYNSSSFTYSELISTEFSIKIGTWEYITLSAYSKCVYSATLSDVEIVEGTNELMFDMNMNENLRGSGCFNVTLNFPSDAKVEYAKVTIFYLDGTIYWEDYNRFAVTNHSVVFSPGYLYAVGMYILSFRFFESDGTEIKPGYSELVQIKDGLTSTAERTIENLEKLHSVEYNFNGGKISGDSIPMSFIEQESVLLPTAQDISKLGYDFAGWYTTAEFDGDAVTEIPTGTRNDVALFAKWNPTLYKIAYEGVEGVANDNPETYTIEDEITLSALEDSVFLKFEKWLLNGKTVTVISKGTTGDIVLVASWKVTIELSAEEAITSLAQKISEQTGENSFNIIITGTLTSEQLSSIAQIIKNSEKKIELDLGRTTGLDTIPSSVFANCTNLESIVIPYGVTEIGISAFQECTNLKTITVPGTLAKIGAYAFYKCSAVTAVHCDGIESWRKIEFGNSSSNPLYVNVKNYQYVTRLYFNGNDITTAIYIYNITYIGLDGASNSNPKTYDSRIGLVLVNPVKSGVKFDGWRMQGIVVSIGSNTGTIKEIAPGTKGDITLIANWKEGFYDTAKSAASGSLKSWLENQTGVGPFDVYLTESLTSDQLSTIAGVLKQYPTKMVRLDLSETTGLTELGGFSSCKSLETIIIPKGVTKISNKAFVYCDNLTTVKIPSTVKRIGSSAFWNWDESRESLTNVYLDDIASWCKVEFDGYIGTAQIDTFTNPLVFTTHLFVNGEETKDIVIPNGVTSINYRAFSCRPYRWIGGRDYITYIESITIPGSVEKIDNNSFDGCIGLKKIIMNYGVKEIGKQVFSACTSLIEVTIPSSMTKIGSNAFENCSNLNGVYISNITSDVALSVWCAIDFVDAYANPLYHAKHLYANNAEVTSVVILDNAKNINKYAFYNCINIQSVTIGSDVTYIGSCAFYGCTNLTSVKFKDTVGWSCGDVTDATANAAKLCTTGNGNWGDSELRKK